MIEENETNGSEEEDCRVMRGGGRSPAYATVEKHQQEAALPDYYGDRQAARLRVWVRVLSSVSLALLISVVVLGVYKYGLLDDDSDDSFSPPSLGSGSDDCSSRECKKNPSSYLFGSLKLPQWRALPPNETVLTTVAFGSCSSQRMPLPYFDTVVMDAKPDLLLLMGDNVYGDCIKNMTNVTAACEPLRQAYRDFARHPSVLGAAPLLSVFATLDDHDYGIGDADMHNPFKELARQLFIDFFQIPLQQLPADGVYRSRIWGDAGRRLQVILLDTRFGRSSFLFTGNRSSPYQPYTTTTDDYQMLSDTQWQWLTAQLEEPADLRLIVSSVQVLNDVTGFECWRHIPNERDRFKDLIRNKSVILLSGDRHVGGFYQDGSLHEITASSWTHTQPFGAFSNCSSAKECDEKDPRRDGDLVRVNHFGTIAIDWERRNVTVALRKAESSYASSYFHPGYSHGKRSDADDVIMERSWLFPF